MGLDTIALIVLWFIITGGPGILIAVALHHTRQRKEK